MYSYTNTYNLLSREHLELEVAYVLFKNVFEEEFLEITWKSRILRGTML